MRALILIFVFSFLATSIFSQTYFYLEEINIISANDVDDVVIQIVGSKSDPCSYPLFINTSYNSNTNVASVNMDWWSTSLDPPYPGCPAVLEPWDTLINFGILTAGDWVLDLTGANFLQGDVPDDFTISVETVNSNENNNKIAVDFYPNPATETLYFKGEIAKINRIEIRDNTGRTVLNETIDGQSKSIPLSMLSKGIYMVIGYDTDGGILVIDRLVK